MVALLDFIAEMLQTNHWGYLYSCACPVYPRLVRDFYGHLEVVQGDDSGIILQTTVRGHTIQITLSLSSPLLMSQCLPFQPVLSQRYWSLLAWSIFMDFFYAHPQGKERAHSHIKIGAFSPPHRLLAKIVLHNLWPIARRSELVLKMAHFLYALVMRIPFCLCKHILNTMLDMRDDHSTLLPFACLITKIYLQSVTYISNEPRMRVQDPLRNHTLMKSNAQLRFEGQGKEPPPPLVQGDQHAAASSSQTAPPPPSYDAGFA